MLVFYILAALVVLQSLLSLRGGVRYLGFFRRALDAPRALYMPFATVFVPCRRPRARNRAPAGPRA